MFQCLKCQHEYEAESQDEADLMKCPKCQSKMVIKSEKESFPVRKISSDKVNKENIVKARPPHDSRNK
jgi:DNA-directed RNA polymerase subunit RPC12/RpoP